MFYLSIEYYPYTKDLVKIGYFVNSDDTSELLMVLKYNSIKNFLNRGKKKSIRYNVHDFGSRVTLWLVQRTLSQYLEGDNNKIKLSYNEPPLLKTKRKKAGTTFVKQYPKFLMICVN